ncbi:MAG: HD-GYP domain-containing protein, partial [Phycisphaerae bacterium]|nr:HD-GYP domain-containing protein [Phycisphaerae bacterium]
IRGWNCPAEFLLLIEQKDIHTYRHCRRVAVYAQSLAAFAGCPTEQIRRVSTAGLMHDIGKVYVPLAILSKAENLTAGEFSQIQSHCRLGQEILRANPVLAEVAHIVRHHHERWDGQGYPDGLAGKEIPIAARIIHLADSLDAMLQPRSYKEAYTLQRALAEIQRCRGTQFDPQLADTAREWIHNNGLTQTPQKLAA